ncbi:acyltransferase [uncultured Proteiniphilum sp.]|uniref:acyltransferase family protein n=1 Tax=uncultured Proteiniphilum sp. TaxID=497637 RepID=UPI00262D33DB|nr:acyltransferase [uncultured Proteiniphilum sp.]
MTTNLLTNQRPRNASIDILKFIAAILITNSHMDMLYVAPFEQLATGGSIGNGLFFFCSGFTLFLGRLGRFDNWYKRRINRIYPTVFAWAILSAAIFSSERNMVDVLLHGGGWFVSCIMIYYVVLYFVRRFAINKLPLVFVLSAVVVIAVYAYYVISGNFLNGNGSFDQAKWITGETYFKWVYNFLFMLMGAMLGISKKRWNYKLLPDLIKLGICVMLFYVPLFLGKKIEIVSNFQVISLIPLIGIMFYFYKICNSNLLTQIYNNKYSGAVIKTIGGLCLEIYLVQPVLFTDKMNRIFPVNILIIFTIILVSAYILRCVSRIFAQTFKEGDYDWKEVVKVY